MRRSSQALTGKLSPRVALCDLSPWRMLSAMLCLVYCYHALYALTIYLKKHDLVHRTPRKLALFHNLNRRKLYIITSFSAKLFSLMFRRSVRIKTRMQGRLMIALYIPCLLVYPAQSWLLFPLAFCLPLALRLRQAQRAGHLPNHQSSFARRLALPG